LKVRSVIHWTISQVNWVHTADSCSAWFLSSMITLWHHN
jgi:hypothetical protein